MKFVNCYECKKELKFTDASPLWNRFDAPPDFLCEECSKGASICEDENRLALMIARKFARDNQPERSKREDLENSLIASKKKIWDSVEIDIKFTEEDLEKSKMRCSEHLTKAGEAS
jgi:hypothetical protein